LRLDSFRIVVDFSLMSDVESILLRLQQLGPEDTKLIGKAVLEHLEELDEIDAYDAAKAKDEEIESLDAVLSRYSKPETA
jgi:hypothetical protein